MNNLNLFEKKMELIFFNSRDQLLRINMRRIAYFEGDGNLTYIVMTNKMKGTVSMNIGKMEEFLAMQYGKKARFFMRIGKRFIINMNYIYQVNVAKQMLVLSDFQTFAFQVPVSKEALKKVKEQMLISKI